MSQGSLSPSMAVSSSTEAHSASLGTGELRWLEQGAGTPLVLLHGIGSNAGSWTRQMTAFADCRVLAWNAPGYGGSTALAALSPDAGDYAGVLTAWLDRLRLERIHLVGHSLGCLIAARFAATQPQRLLTLTLASIAAGHARLPAQERQRLLDGRLDDVEQLGAGGMAEKRGPRLCGPLATQADVSAVIAAMAAVDPHGYAQAARMLSSGDILADVERLPAALPVQIVFGRSDVITSPAANRRVAAHLPQARIVEIPQAGHACPVDSAVAFNAAISEFISP